MTTETPKPVKELKAGDKAPAFSLKNSAGKTVKLSDFKGRRLVLYFYPRDNTPGCTKEACAFRDISSKLQALNAAVVGISTDDVASHEKFAAKFELNFPLLADTENAVAEKYGVWQEKNNYGKKYFGIARTTFVIDEEGRIAKVFKRVKVDGHDDQVLAALAAMA